MTVWGLDLGLRTMRRGEFSRFLLKPSYAYGEMGCPPLIPPGATVLYEVQVIDYLDSAQVDEFFALLPVSFETHPTPPYVSQHTKCKPEQSMFRFVG